MKEYIVLKKIPHCDNEIDTFVKEEHIIIEKDNKKNEFNVVKFYRMITREIDRSSSEGVGANIQLTVEKIVATEHMVKQLVEHGYLEEYVDNILTS